SMAISAGAQLLIDGELVLRPTSAVQGDGQIVINDGGSAHVAVAVVFETDVINNGTLINGLGEQPSFVDLDGSFTQGATGRMLVNIGTDSPTAIEADVLMTSLGVQLAGELNISHSFAHEPVLG